MIEIDTTAFDLALAGLEAELNHTLVPLADETTKIADTMEMIKNFLENKPCSL